ncbi:MAG: hypothetical protein ACXWAT_15300, partial [Methylobacter sp.]
FFVGVMNATRLKQNAINHANAFCTPEGIRHGYSPLHFQETNEGEGNLVFCRVTGLIECNDYTPTPTPTPTPPPYTQTRTGHSDIKLPPGVVGVVIKAKNWVTGKHTYVEAALQESGYGVDAVTNCCDHEDHINSATYEFFAPVAGSYEFNIEYASADSRPIQVTLNNVIEMADAASVPTGGFRWKDRKMEYQKTVILKAGKNELTFDRGHAIPHIHNFVFIFKPDDPASQPTTVTIPAVDFHLGHHQFTERASVASGYGTDVLTNCCDGADHYDIAEYEFNATAAGTYLFQIEYASGDSRPMKVTLNGAVIMTDAASIPTGGFLVANQQLINQKNVTLVKGNNVLRIERDHAIPHLRKFMFVPI